MRCVARAMVSVPPTRTDPLRLPVSPRTALSVVVRPAPLRPSSVTTSPRRTSKSTPCRICDSPYHACRSCTLNITGGSLTPAMGSVNRAHVRFDHLGIAGDLRIGTLGEHRSPLQDRDGIGDVRDHAHVVLD